MVPPETVFAQRIGDLLLIQITEFNRSTDSHLAEVIGQGFASARPPEGIILDLRGDRGGLLRQAVSAADTLLPAGVVAMTVGRDPERDADLALQSGRVGGRHAGCHRGRRSHGQRGRDPGRCTGGPRPRRGDRQFDARQGAGADHRGIAGRWGAVRYLEPRARSARLADPGPGRAASGLHQPGAEHSELAARGAGAGAAADGAGAGGPPGSQGTAATQRRSWQSATTAPPRRVARRTSTRLVRSSTIRRPMPPRCCRRSGPPARRRQVEPGPRDDPSLTMSQRNRMLC